MGSNPPLLPPICEEQPHSESQRVESKSLRDESQRANFDQEVDTNSLERDPGLRPQIDTLPPNQRGNVRRAYILLGPCQPKLKEYPSHLEGKQMRRFNGNWYNHYPWLEYYVHKDKVFYFRCFLFDIDHSHKAFTVDGFRNWRRVGGKECAFLTHVGIINSPHHFAIQKWMDLKNPTHHIDRVVQPQQEVSKNRLRLTTTIEAVRYLANQGMAFRGDDESHDSFNRGNFIELVKVFARMNEEVEKVVLQNAPLNAQYISHKIQKEILNIYANKVRKRIRDEIGEDEKFCILVDEALDDSKKEQMAIIIRFVSCDGHIRERFFDIVSVHDTNFSTLKSDICKVFSKQYAWSRI
ncbi:zinc finger MYM-type protein 1-like [Prunus dulcis]|uniref:zinc finger MYM-type protein 1-like n=1 Tax=Prunus dulcis TaxID=3755 RepID=UPI001482D767|nr:zinc finger MYM-type protein 1-like [Prunus dulcis]